MAFVNNNEKQVLARGDIQEAKAGGSAAFALGQQSIPLIFTPFVGQAAVGDSPAYELVGRDTHSIFVYSTNPASAASGISLEVWGTQTMKNNSWVKLATITTLGSETKILGQYFRIIFSLQTLTTAGAGINVDVSSYRAG